MTYTLPARRTILHLGQRLRTDAWTFIIDYLHQKNLKIAGAAVCTQSL